MNDMQQGASGGRRPRVVKNKYITKSGKTIKVNHSLKDRVRAHKEASLRRKAEALHTLPKGRVRRFFARLHPKRMYRYWFSREGVIMAMKLIGVGAVAGFLLTVGVFAYFRKDLPNLKDISGDNIGGSVRYFDRTGEVLLWEDYDAVKRVPVKDEDIHQHLKDATIAIEDKEFFKHSGFDVKGIARAGFNNFTNSSGGQQGGSTITQQLVKLTQKWSTDVTYTRKIKELILAIELERSYSKQEILTGYLNTAPYGDITYGAEAAMQDYFHKPAKDMTLDEAAFLAAIPKSPTFYSPYGARYDKEMLTNRQDYILEQMAVQGKITREQAEEAKKIDTTTKIQKRTTKFAGIKAPYFVLAAKKQLERDFGSATANRSGWTVVTSVDMKLQQIAEEKVQATLPIIRRQGGDTAAFAAEDVTTGQIVALVGGADFNDPVHGQFNFATSPLPPGSSFKPYDYAALIEHSNNFGAGSVLYDTQGPLEGYPCTKKAMPPPKGDGNCLWNYDFRYPGPMTLRYALGGSRNVPAVKAMLTVGVDKTIETAEKLGLESGYNCYRPGLEDISTATKEDERPCFASSAIGDGAYLHLDEHVHSYGTLSRNGVKLDQTYILKISDAQGKTIDEWKKEAGEQVLKAETAYIISDMMSDPNASYFPAGRKPHHFNGWRFAMKTGTTNDAKDGWMMGYSSKYAAGVWVGYHTRQVEMRGTMESMTQPIWHEWMKAAHTGLPAVDWEKPSGLQTLPAYVIREHVGIGSVEPSTPTDLFPSWYKQPTKVTNTKRTIDIVSNKLATECTPARARKEVIDSDASAFSGDRFYGDGGGTTTNERDDIHKCSDAKPSITLTVNDLSQTGKYQFVATISKGTHPLSSDKYKGKVVFKVDGEIIPNGEFDIDESGTITVNYTASKSGTSTVSAEVTDSVLYDATDSTTEDFKAASTTSSGGGGNNGNGNGNGGGLRLPLP